MNEFKNRIDAQRKILNTVNKRHWGAEELSGLSDKAITRWIVSNQIDSSSRLTNLIRAAGHSLFFLANKSQEQITEEYQHRSQEVAELTLEISTEIKGLFES